MLNKLTFVTLMICILGMSHQQKLFRCFFYFEKEFVSYNLKDLYLKNISDHLDFDYNHNGTDGKLIVNICDGVSRTDQCKEDTRKNCLCNQAKSILVY